MVSSKQAGRHTCPGPSGGAAGPVFFSSAAPATGGVPPLRPESGSAMALGPNPDAPAGRARRRVCRTFAPSPLGRPWPCSGSGVCASAFARFALKLLPGTPSSRRRLAFAASGFVDPVASCARSAALAAGVRGRPGALEASPPRLPRPRPRPRPRPLGSIAGVWRCAARCGATALRRLSTASTPSLGPAAAPGASATGSRPGRQAATSVCSGSAFVGTPAAAAASAAAALTAAMGSGAGLLTAAMGSGAPATGAASTWRQQATDFQACRMQRLSVIYNLQLHGHQASINRL